MAVMPSSAHELVGLELQLKQVGDARRRFRRFVRTRDGEIALIGPRNLARRLLTGIEALDRLLLLMRVRVRLRLLARARTAHLRFDIDLLAERLVESGALDEVAWLAREWFHRHLIPGYSNAPDATQGAPSA